MMQSWAFSSEKLRHRFEELCCSILVNFPLQIVLDCKDLNLDFEHFLGGGGGGMPPDPLRVLVVLNFVPH